MNLKIKTISASVYEALKSKNTPTSLEWLAKNFLFPKKDIKKALFDLLDEKKIVRAKGKCFALIKDSSDEKGRRAPATLLKGKLISHPDGYAFFAPETGGDDIFIPSTKLLGAVDGDIVMVKKTKYRGRVEGHVTEIIERKLTSVVGRIEHNKGHCIVIPLHKKLTMPIAIRDGSSYKEDDIVVCKINRFPTPNRQALGEVVKKLGHLSDPGIENAIVMCKYDLTPEFEPSVQAEADSVAGKVLKKGNNEGRFDLRDLFTVTIDGETARDFDDAISIEKDDKGYTLYVHIADVAYYVKSGGEIDKEAFNRGTSVYFPEFAIPMLPEVLSNGVCSLKPNEDRFSMSAKIRYGFDGVRKDSKLYQSVMRSDHRLTYTYVNEVLAGEESADGKLKELVTLSHELMKLIQKRRKGQGTIDFDLPDVNFIFDKNGNIAEIMPEERGISERIIEHFMIEANEVVAETLDKVAPYSIYRNHGRPDPLKLEQWAKTAENFGYTIPEIPEEITSRVVQRWFAEIENKRYSYIIKSMLVRSMQRAEYSVENTGHFGLASEFYTHFTSPIRRYPDLMIHRLLKRYYFKSGEEVAQDYVTLAASQSSITERKGEEAEREIHLYKKLAYLRNNPDREYPAFISKVTSNGFSVFLTELLLYGFVDITVVGLNGFNTDTERGAVRSRDGKLNYFAGDELTVVWSGTDMDRLEAYFAVNKMSGNGDFRPKNSKKPNNKSQSKSKSPKHYKKFAKKKSRHKP